MNLVEITVHSDTSQALRAIDELKTKLDVLGTKVAEARVRLAGNDAAQLQISRINARLIELNRYVANPRIDLGGIARAQAEILALMAALDKLNNMNSGPKFTFGQGSSGFFGAIQKGLAAILNLGPGAIPVLAGIAAAVLAIVEAVGSLITEVSAAGLGVAAFGLFAVPTFQKIFAGITAVSGAADKTARSAAWKAIPAALQPAVQAGLALKGVFDKLVAAMQPTAVRVFGDALKIVSDLLPQLLPIALSVGKAIDGLLRGFDGFVRSAGFKAFISQMDALSGPAVTAIGRGIGQIAVALGKLLAAGASPTGLTVLKGVFDVLAGSINAVALGIRGAANGLKSLELIALSAGRLIVSVAKNITDSFLGALRGIVDIAAMIPGPWQSAARSIQRSLAGAQRTADTFFANTTAKLDQMTAHINNADPIYTLHGNITDLQNKVAAAKASLKTVPKSEQTRILANISQLERQIAAARAALNALSGYTIDTYVNVITQPVGGPHSETGGIIGARAGGGPWGGLTMVGEHGRELVSLPTGSTVHSNPDTERMLGQMSGPGGLRLIMSVDPRMPPGLSRELLSWIRFAVSTEGGGDVQAAFGGS